MELFIPTRMGKDNIFGKGFGKKEMKRTVVFSVIGLALGLIAGLSIFNANFQSVMISTVVGGVITTSIGYFVTQKNSINLSVYDYVHIIKVFFITQQFYKFKKLKEWY